MESKNLFEKKQHNFWQFETNPKLPLVFFRGDFLACGQILSVSEAFVKLQALVFFIFVCLFVLSPK